MYEIYVSSLYLLLGKVFLQDTAGKCLCQKVRLQIKKTGIPCYTRPRCGIYLTQLAQLCDMWIPILS